MLQLIESLLEINNNSNNSRRTIYNTNINIKHFYKVLKCKAYKKMTLDYDDFGLIMINYFSEFMGITIDVEEIKKKYFESISSRESFEKTDLELKALLNFYFDKNINTNPRSNTKQKSPIGRYIIADSSLAFGINVGVLSDINYNQTKFIMHRSFNGAYKKKIILFNNFSEEEGAFFEMLISKNEELENKNFKKIAFHSISRDTINIDLDIAIIFCNEVEHPFFIQKKGYVKILEFDEISLILNLYYLSDSLVPKLSIKIYERLVEIVNYNDFDQTIEVKFSMKVNPLKLIFQTKLTYQNLQILLKNFLKTLISNDATEME
jgi:hypothetical protein